MTDSHHISFTLHAKLGDHELSPESIPFARLNLFNQQVETFLAGHSRDYQTDELKVKIENGSYKLLVWLPATLLPHLQQDLSALQSGASLDAIDSKRATILNQWQKTSITEPHTSFEITPTWSPAAESIRIHHDTSFTLPEDKTLWVETEKYIKGEILEAGGSTRTNLHLKVEEQSRFITIGASKSSLKGQPLGRVYEEQVIRIKAEENYRTGELRNLEFIEFVDYQPAFDADELDALIEQASPKWADVPDTNVWLDQIRNDANES